MRRRGEDSEDSRGLLVSSSTEYERLGALDLLRSACAQPFDAERPDHTRALKDLWASAFPDASFALPSERWKEAGFQGTDPRTDLRGAGFLGLVHLQQLLTQHDAGLVGLADDLPPEISGLPIAIASINCTAMLLSHLQLAPKLTCAFMPGGRCECSQETLHAFLSLGWEGSTTGGDRVSARPELSPPRGGAASAAALGDDSDEAAAVRRLNFALTAMHGRLVMHLGRTWRRMSAEPTTTLMDFPTALRETHAHLQRALRAAGSAPWRLEALTTHLENEAPAQPLLDAARESFGPLSEAVADYSSWAFSSAFYAVSSAYNAVIGLCFSAPPDDVHLHDKRS